MTALEILRFNATRVGFARKGPLKTGARGQFVLGMPAPVADRKGALICCETGLRLNKTLLGCGISCRSFHFFRLLGPGGRRPGTRKWVRVGVSSSAHQLRWWTARPPGSAAKWGCARTKPFWGAFRLVRGPFFRLYGLGGRPLGPRKWDWMGCLSSVCWTW